MWDTHHYEEPTYFLKNFDYFDNWQESTDNENVTVIIGEYSVYQIDTPDGIVNYSNPVDLHVSYPRLLSAIAEGIYLLGAERNQNTVKMTTYAPTFQNFNFFNWTPDLVGFSANPMDTVLSLSWYVQSLFAHYRGTESLPVTAVRGEINPLWWVATIDGPTNAIYLKVIQASHSALGSSDTC